MRARPTILEYFKTLFIVLIIANLTNFYHLQIPQYFQFVLSIDIVNLELNFGASKLPTMKN